MQEIDVETWQEIYNLLTPPPSNSTSEQVFTPPKKQPKRKTKMTEEERKRKRREDVKLATRRMRQRQKDEILFLRKRLLELQKEPDHVEENKSFDLISKPQSLLEWKKAVEKRNEIICYLQDDQEFLKAKLADLNLHSAIPRAVTIRSSFKYLNFEQAQQLCNDTQKAFVELYSCLSYRTSNRISHRVMLDWNIEIWNNTGGFGLKCRKFFEHPYPQKIFNTFWNELDNLDRYRQSRPDVVEWKIIQDINSDMKIIYRREAISPKLNREFLSSIFRIKDDKKLLLGSKSIDHQLPCRPNCVQGDECSGFIVEPSTYVDQNGIERKGFFFQNVVRMDFNGNKDFISDHIINECAFAIIRFETSHIKPIMKACLA